MRHWVFKISYFLHYIVVIQLIFLKLNNNKTFQIHDTFMFLILYDSLDVQHKFQYFELWYANTCNQLLVNERKNFCRTSNSRLKGRSFYLMLNEDNIFSLDVNLYIDFVPKVCTIILLYLFGSKLE